MAQPITWSNINGPALNVGNGMMNSAQQSFGNVFTGLNDVLKKREATDAANWDQGKVNNTNAFLNATQEAKTPEEFAAKEAQLRQMLGGYGAQVDATAARSALDGRMTALQQRALASIQYNDAAAEDKAKGIKDIIKSRILENNFDGAKAILDGMELPNESALYESLKTGQRKLVTDANADTITQQQIVSNTEKIRQDPLKFASDLKTAAASQAASYASAEHATAQAERARQEGTKIKNEGSLNALAKAGYTEAYKHSILASGVIGIGKGTDNLATGLKAANIPPEDINGIMMQVQNRFPNGIPSGKGADGKPKFSPIPVDFVLRAAQRSTGHWYGEGHGTNTADLMEEMLKSPTSGIHEELANGLDLHSKLFEKPLERERVGSFVDPKRVDPNDPAMGGTASRAIVQAALKDATSKAYGVTTAPSMAEERLARAKAEAEKKSPEIAVLSSVATPKGAEDFSIHSVTGKAQKPSGPAVIPPDAKITSSFTAVKMNPNFMPSKDTGMVTATVTGVEDGDGAYLKTKGTNRDLTCRLAGIDAPEVDHPKVGKKGQAFGEEAKTSLMKKILNQEVEVNVTKANDGKGRSICQITLKGRNINREELIEGAAWINKTYNKNPEDIAAFDNARTLKKGLHADTNAIPPWEHRKTW